MAEPLASMLFDPLYLIKQDPGPLSAAVENIHTQPDIVVPMIPEPGPYGSDGTKFDDLLFGTEKPDWIRGGKGDDVIWGGGGDDVLVGEDGNDTLYGGIDDDIISGGDGNDKLFGGPGDDSLEGGAGQDLLVGGGGRDYLVGGEGRDVFRYETYSDSPLKFNALTGENKEEWDVIADFKHGEDKIDLSALDANVYEPGNQAFTVHQGDGLAGAGEITWYFDGYSTVVTFGNGSETGAIKFPGEHQFTASDFIL